MARLVLKITQGKLQLSNFFKKSEDEELKNKGSVLVPIVMTPESWIN
jgi:hypothetical protein